MRIEIRDNSVTIEGYVNVVERESRMLRDSQGAFVEVVKAGTFANALQNNPNVELRFNHEQHLGDVASGTVELREDCVGLYAKAKVSDSDIISKAEKKELRGWSFGFVCQKADWNTVDGVRKRTLEQIELREVSILDKTPAYIATSIEMRDEEEYLIEFRSEADEIETIEHKENDKKEEPSYFFEETELEIIRIRGGKTVMKKYIEKRNALVVEMENLLNKAKEETRAFNEEESNRYAEISKEIKGIDEMLKIDEESRALELKKIDSPEKKDQEAEELRAFENYIRGRVEERAANLDTSNNGAVIPSTIANKIIETVKNIAPIYALATKYNVKGDLVFPVYDETSGAISCAYSDEFTPLVSTSGKFTSVALKGFLAGALTKVSMSLVNATNFDLVSYVIAKMAQSIAEFIEKELIVGTSGKCTGVTSATVGITAAAGTAITADELIDLQGSVIKAYQANARWLMSEKTRIAVAKLKDGNDNYLLQRDITNGFGYTLLGRPVEISDNMPEIGAGNVAVVYGDFSGLAVKLNGSIDVQVMREKFLDEHAIGVVGWVELDSKIVEPQKIRTLKCGA